jgi:hypothetical protein
VYLLTIQKIWVGPVCLGRNKRLASPPSFLEKKRATHHHHPLILVSGVGTTCFLLPFSSITRHLHAHCFYSHVILHTVRPSFLRSTSSRVPSILALFVMWLSSLCITCPYQANLLLLIFSVTGATCRKWRLKVSNIDCNQTKSQRCYLFGVHREWVFLSVCIYLKGYNNSLHF